MKITVERRAEIVSDANWKISQFTSLFRDAKFTSDCFKSELVIGVMGTYGIETVTVVLEELGLIEKDVDQTTKIEELEAKIEDYKKETEEMERVMSEAKDELESVKSHIQEVIDELDI